MSLLNHRSVRCMLKSKKILQGYRTSHLEKRTHRGSSSLPYQINRLPIAGPLAHPLTTGSTARATAASWYPPPLEIIDGDVTAPPAPVVDGTPTVTPPPLARLSAAQKAASRQRSSGGAAVTPFSHLIWNYCLSCFYCLLALVSVSELVVAILLSSHGALGLLKKRRIEVLALSSGTTVEQYAQ